MELKYALLLAKSTPNEEYTIAILSGEAAIKEYENKIELSIQPGVSRVYPNPDTKADTRHILLEATPLSIDYMRQRIRAAVPVLKYEKPNGESTSAYHAQENTKVSFAGRAHELEITFTDWAAMKPYPQYDEHPDC